MRSEQARIGMRVRVHNGLGDAALRGREGTITAKYGHPDYAALDVLLDDGRSQLFWHYELDEVEEEAA